MKGFDYIIFVNNIEGMFIQQNRGEKPFAPVLYHNQCFTPQLQGVQDVSKNFWVFYRDDVVRLFQVFIIYL